MNNNTYTLETLPIEIGTNQFYCLCRRNGKIMIGNIIGVSALTGYGLYEINGRQYKVFPSDTFKEDKYETVVGDRISCYLHYQDFVKAYYEHIEAKAKKRKTQPKTRYFVDKSTFVCRQTKSASRGYNVKIFENKEEAAKYAQKNIARLTKKFEKYKVELNELKEILKKYNVPTESPRMGDLPVLPRNLKENDLLAKIEWLHLKGCNVSLVKKDYAVSVKGFVDPKIAKLSDGTLLIENECGSIYNAFIRYENIDKAKERLKKKNLRGFIRDIDGYLITMEKNEKFYKRYVPFETKDSFNPWFYEDGVKNLIDDTNEYLKMIEE